MNAHFPTVSKPVLALAGLVFFLGLRTWSQNLVEDPGNGELLPPIQVTAQYVSNWTFSAIVSTAPTADPSSEPIRKKLEAHIQQFLQDFPLRPLHLTLGISGHEVCFGHPDEMFYALALSRSALSPSTQAAVMLFLNNCLTNLPPYAVEGFPPQVGRARESYDVPEILRSTAPARANSLFGIYAFWFYCHTFGLPDTIKEHWPKIVKRINESPDSEASFGAKYQTYARDEPEMLNGDLAGWLGYARLARSVGDSMAEATALRRLYRLLEIRVNQERMNATILTPSSSTSKHLHVNRLARYCRMTPEIASALRHWTEGCSARRLQAFREARPGWFMAFGDRYIGGENYTSSAHLAQALFLGAAWIELRPPGELADFLDVPWCRGDFYFMEKCAAILSGPTLSSR